MNRNCGGGRPYPITFAVPLSRTICWSFAITFPLTDTSPVTCHWSEMGAVARLPEYSELSSSPRICSPVPSVLKARPKRHDKTASWLQRFVKNGVVCSSDESAPAKPTRPSCGKVVMVPLLGGVVSMTLAKTWFVAVRPPKETISLYWP